MLPCICPLDTTVARCASGRMRPYRSMIWVNKTTFPHKQIEVASPDITAVLLLTPSPTLAISVYVPLEGGPEGVRMLSQRLKVIRRAHQRVRYEYGDSFNILLVGDSNRHGQLWGGNQVAMQARQGEAEPIVLLMAEWGLTSLLPRRTITYEEGARQSTIDLTLASAGLSRRVMRCGIHPVEHGSDHPAIETTFQTEARQTVAQRPRFLFRRLRGSISAASSNAQRRKS